MFSDLLCHYLSPPLPSRSSSLFFLGEKEYLRKIFIYWGIPKAEADSNLASKIGERGISLGFATSPPSEILKRDQRERREGERKSRKGTKERGREREEKEIVPSEDCRSFKTTVQRSRSETALFWTMRAAYRVWLGEMYSTMGPKKGVLCALL